jgi:hypothetical protein
MGLTCHPGSDELIKGGHALATAGFIATGLFCGLQMLWMIGFTFRRWSGLYFWSLVITTFCIISVNISNILYYWVLKDSCPGITLLFEVPGYLFYVPFEFLILYSRLHLVQTGEKIMRSVLYAIVVEWVVIEVPLAVLIIGVTLAPTSSFSNAYLQWSKAEWMIYLGMDCVLSGVYVYQIRKTWGSDTDRKLRSVLRQVAAMTVFILLVDAIYIVLWFKLPSTITIGLDVSIKLGWLLPKHSLISIKGFLFSFKLLLEIWTLSKLTDISRRRLDISEAEFGSGWTESKVNE